MTFRYPANSKASNEMNKGGCKVICIFIRWSVELMLYPLTTSREWVTGLLFISFSSLPSSAPCPSSSLFLLSLFFPSSYKDIYTLNFCLYLWCLAPSAPPRVCSFLVGFFCGGKEISYRTDRSKWGSSINLGLYLIKHFYFWIGTGWLCIQTGFS